MRAETMGRSPRSSRRSSRAISGVGLVLSAAAHGPGAQARSNGEQSLRQRMPSFLGCDFGPQQVDEPIPRDRARASLEMEVEQDGKMFLGTESDGRVATIHELRGSEKSELKQR